MALDPNTVYLRTCFGWKTALKRILKAGTQPGDGPLESKVNSIALNPHWKTLRLILIVLFWVTMLAWLWKREIGPNREPFFSHTGNSRASLFSECLRQRKDRKDIGVGVLLLQQTPNGCLLRQRGELEMGLGFIEGRLRFAGLLEMSPEFQLSRFRYQFKLGQMSFITRGEVVAEGQVKVLYGPENALQEMTLQLPEGNLNVALASTALLARQIEFKPKRTYRFKQFNPLTASMESVQVRFGTETEILYRNRLVPVLPMEVGVGEMVTSSLVTRDGHTMRESSSLGYESERISAGETLFRLARGGDSVGLMSLIPFGENMDKILDENIHSLQIQFVNFPKDLFGVETDRQRWIDSRECILEVVSSASPCPDFKLGGPFLLSATQQQSVEESVRKKAREVIGSMEVGSQPAKALERLAQWVLRDIESFPSVGDRTPVQVLKTKRGDSNERTQLFVALARAVRIPAREVTGLAYDHGTFLMRKWAKVQWGESQSIELDPGNGTLGVNAGYIQLADTEVDEKQLAFALTNLEVKVTQVGPAPKPSF